MTVNASEPRPAPPTPLAQPEILQRLGQCPPLPSLTRNAHDILKSLSAGDSSSSEICEIIRRDPSLTARILRMVNSVYYGLARPVESIEEAVFFVGLDQVRNVAMVSPLIEDFIKLAGDAPYPWRSFWHHSIAVGLLTREVISAAVGPAQEVDYVAGLVHDVGKIVMGAAFPRHFSEIQKRSGQAVDDLLDLEQSILGMTHTQVGALYLKRQNLPALLIEAAGCHHDPKSATQSAATAAAVQIADLFARLGRLGMSGNDAPVSVKNCMDAQGWDILFPSGNANSRNMLCASLQEHIKKLPALLATLV